MVKSAPPKPKFSAMMPEAEQTEWLQNATYLLDGIRDSVEPSKREEYASRYQAFRSQTASPETINLLRDYVLRTIPYAATTEASFWNIGITSFHSYIRLNIGKQMVLEVHNVTEGLPEVISMSAIPLQKLLKVPKWHPQPIYAFHLPRMSVGKLFDVDMSDIQQDVVRKLSFASKSANQSSPVDIYLAKSYIVAGDDDQAIVLCLQTKAAQFLLAQQKFVLACREFNLRLMLKGRSPWNKSHVYDLADHLLTP